MNFFKVLVVLGWIFNSIFSQELSQFHLIEKMNQFYEKRDWESTYEITSKLTNLNPTKGMFWYGLGESAYNIKKYDESLAAYQKSVELGYWNTWAAYNIACIYSLQGKTDLGVEWINKAVEWGYKNYDWMMKDEDLNNIKDELGFLKLLGKPLPEDLNRVSGWRHDLLFIDDRAKALHYNLYDQITPEEWETVIKSIYDNIPFLSDEEIVMEMMKLVAKIGDGHTSLYPPSESRGAILSFHRLPVIFESFKDGIFITRADEKHENIIGAKVISAGRKSMEDLLNAAGNYLGRDNDMGIKRLGPFVLTFTEFYFGEGVADRKTEVSFSVEIDKKQKTIILEAAGKNAFEFSEVSEDWRKLNSNSTNELPLWLQDNENKYWYKHLPEQKLVYFQYNTIGNKEEQSFEEFSKELYEYISNNGVEYLVIDLRHNGGGNSYLNRYLLETLFKLDNINQTGHLFIIIGRQTFSAAQNLTTDLQYRTNAIFIGEPTASKPNFIGETNNIKLPYSGMTVSLSDRWHQGGASNSRDYRNWIAPDIYIQMTHLDYKNNADPVLDEIFKIINK